MEGGIDTSERSLSVLALEPYYGGSHKAFMDTWIRASRHRFELWTLPARKWKWRMRGAALTFAKRAGEGGLGSVDAVVTSDMLSVADWRALAPAELRTKPILTYFHENQLTYPLADGLERDFQYGFTNITTCLASDVVWFNSESHRSAFLAAVNELFRKMPDHVPNGIAKQIEERSRIVWPMIEAPPRVRRPLSNMPPFTILWNHRWEYDKNPESLFSVLSRLHDDGVDFRLVVLGETFREQPGVFKQARHCLGDKIIKMGRVENRDEYWKTLQACDIVISTAIQENFGISIVEAILAGCTPLLPNRLCYPEILRFEESGGYLYNDDEDLYQRLGAVLKGTNDVPRCDNLGDRLSDACGVSHSISLYDNMLCQIAGHIER